MNVSGKGTPIEIVEVSPRDGLQSDETLVSTENKVALIERLIDAGARRLEVASFVNPARVPQMADAEAVLAALPDRDDVTYIGLVLNERGVDRALKTKVDQVGAVALPTDTFGMKNQKQTSLESVEVASNIVRLANERGCTGQVTISASFGCPYEGEVAPERIVEIAKRIADVDPVEISLADTIGVAVPAQVRDLVGAVQAAVPHIPLRCHFHNTRNTGIANAWAAVEAGVKILDASLGAVGGCPFAPHATGNIGTEDLAYMLGRMGYETGLNLEKLVATATWLEQVLEHQVPALLGRAGIFPDCAKNLKIAS